MRDARGASPVLRPTVRANDVLPPSPGAPKRTPSERRRNASYIVRATRVRPGSSRHREGHVLDQFDRAELLVLQGGDGGQRRHPASLLMKRRWVPRLPPGAATAGDPE